MNKDLKTLCQTADNAWNEAFGHEFGADSWGIYCCSDTEADWLGSIGSFIWFDSKEKMFEFISTVIPYLSVEEVPISESPCEDALEISSVIDELMKGNVLIDDGLNAINEVLCGNQKIEWCGQFFELCRCASDFSREIVSNYRENQDDDTLDLESPIKSSEFLDFKEFIECYNS